MKSPFPHALYSVILLLTNPEMESNSPHLKYNYSILSVLALLACIQHSTATEWHCEISSARSAKAMQLMSAFLLDCSLTICYLSRDPLRTSLTSSVINSSQRSSRLQVLWSTVPAKPHLQVMPFQAQDMWTKPPDDASPNLQVTQSQSSISNREPK